MCVSVDKPSVVHVPFSIRIMLCQIWITYKFQDIWRVFTRVRECTGGQTDKPNAWKNFNFVGEFKMGDEWWVLRTGCLDVSDGGHLEQL